MTHPLCDDREMTIAESALAYDLDLARARMQSSRSEAIINEEWRDLTEAQRLLFESFGIVSASPPSFPPSTPQGDQ